MIMSILQKAYDTIKRRIKFEFFKRKFNSWYDLKEIENTEFVNDAKDYILKQLVEGNFNNAFYKYNQIQETLNDIERLKNFKRYVLENENNEH